MKLFYSINLFLFFFLDNVSKNPGLMYVTLCNVCQEPEIQSFLNAALK